jgi:hypothetical protein
VSAVFVHGTFLYREALVRVKQINVAEGPSTFSLTVCSAPNREIPVRLAKIRMAEILSVFAVG